MRSVNNVVMPELSESLVMESVRKAQEGVANKEDAEKSVALDFYYHKDVDKHIDQWFSKATLNQVPSFPQKIVPRFAKARMMLYKNSPLRMINGDVNESYSDYSNKLNQKVREFAELSWLTSSMGLRTRWNERRSILEYDIIPYFKRYMVDGEMRGVSYEVERDAKNNRIFVFWSDELHFKYDQAGRMIQVNDGNENPYGVIPVSFVDYPQGASDVIRASIQIGIANTEIALAERFSFGQPVASGLDNATTLTMGIDKVMILPEGASFSFVGSPGSLKDMSEVTKSFANQTALNNHLRIKWDDSGNPQSGEAIRMLEIENLEARVSDIPIWREWERERYEIDRSVIRAHTGKDLGERYSVDFAEIEFPKSPQEERAELDWKLEKGLISREDLFRHFNPDISDEDLKTKLGEVDEAKAVETKATPPQFEGLRKLGSISS
mgnify:FL=1